MIETKRLQLVNYREEDLPFLKQMVGNPNMMRFIGDGKVRDDVQAVQFLERILGHYEVQADFGLKLLIHKETGAKIGHAGLVPQTIEGVDYIEVGYWIDEPYWGQGYASEVAIALIRYGFDVLQLPELMSLIQHGNVASEKVALKNGMVKKRDVALSGKDVHFYMLLNNA